LRSSNIQGGRLAFDDCVFVDMELPPRVITQKNDLLVCVRNGSRNLIGKCALIDESTAGSAFGAFMAVLRSESSIFLRHVFQSEQVKQQINERMGATINQITNRDMAEFEVVWPSDAEERTQIGRTLSDFEMLIESLELLLAKKRQIKQGAMQELLTGQRRLPGFSGNWKSELIGSIADVKTGPFGSSLHESDYVDDGTPIVTVEHLGEFGLTRQNLPMVSVSDRQRLRAYELEAGDIVFSRVGSVDRNALVRPDEAGWLFSGRLLRVRPSRSRVVPEFLSYQFHSEPFKASVLSVAVGQTMASLNTSILKGLVVALPALDEQTAIATILSDMDTEITALEARLIKARQLKQGMAQALLTGRIRLV
jgi:type I restriction enzyme S subunit